MENEELVSVIMPTYNAGKYLAGSIASILRQTHRNLELLITDDGSTDPLTLQTLRDMERNDGRVDVLFLDANHGAGYARNKSIERARGRYIAFCDSDDLWAADKLERQLAFMGERRCALSCAAYTLFDSARQREVGICVPPATITFAMMRRDNKVGCLTAVYDTQMLGRKYYMPTLRKRQDWALFLQIVRDCKVCYACPGEPLASYNIRRGSISHKKWALAKYNVAVYREILGYGWLKSRLYFALLFLPTYGCKVVRRRIDSFLYMRKRRENR